MACPLQCPETFQTVQGELHDEHTTQTHLGHSAFVGHRSRAGDFRRVFRLELWLGRGGNIGLPGDLVNGRRHVHLLYIQFHRADHRDSSRWRPVCLQPPGVWRERWLDCRAGDADRVRLRPARDRPGHRRVPERAVSGPRSETCGRRRLHCVHGPEHPRGEARRHL